MLSETFLWHSGFMRVRKAENVFPSRYSEIRLLAGKMFYNNIIPTGIVWLGYIHSIIYYN